MATATAPELQTAPNGQAFDLDKHLDNPNFVKFLGVYQDSESLDMSPDNPELKKRFEAFERQSKISKEFKDVLTKRISEEVSIKLDAGDLDAVEQYLMKTAIESPEQLEQLERQLQQFKELPGQIKQLEDSVSAFGNRAELVEKQQQLGKAGSLKAPKLFWLAKKDWRKNKKERDEVLNKYDLEVNKLKGELGATNEKVENLLGEEEKLKARIGEMDILKNEIFVNLDIANTIRERMKDRVVARIDTLRNAGKTLDSFKKRQEYYGKLGANEDFEYVATDRRQGFENELENDIEEHMRQEFARIVKDSSLTSAPFKNLERALKPYLETQTLGSRNQEETRKLILESLENIETDPALDHSKRILVKRLLVKLTTNNTTT
jgi:hypothetical protein